MVAGEKRLIDANAIEYPEYFYTGEEAEDPFIEGFHQGKIDAINDIRALAPTVDAVPVAHGRWNKWRPPQNMVLIGVEMLNVCSECTAKYVQTFSYCPNCGAKMENEAPHVGLTNVDLED